MAMKKSTPSGKPKDTPSRKTISPTVTVLGKKITRVPESASYRAPFSAKQMKELKAIIAKAEAAKMALSPKAAKKEAKLIKDANKNSSKKAAKGAKFAEKNAWASPARSKIEGFKGSTSRGFGGGGLGGGSVTQRPK